jgi:hypothetical protein
LSSTITRFGSYKKFYQINKRIQAIDPVELACRSRFET